MSTMVQIAQANASRVSSTDPPLNGTSAVALMKSDGVCAWASLMPFLNSAGLCLYPSMSGTTLLSAAESAKGVTFAGHYWGPGQYQVPVQHSGGGGGGGGGSSSSGPGVLASFGLGLGQGVLNIANGTQDALIGMCNLGIQAQFGWLGAFGVTVPTISSPDWSTGKLTAEDPTLHNVSKFIGGQAVITLVTIGASEFAQGASAAGEVAAAEVPEVPSSVQSIAKAGDFGPSASGSQAALDEVIASDPALENVELSVHPQYNPALEDFGVTSRGGGLPTEVEIGPKSFASQDELVDSIGTNWDEFRGHNTCIGIMGGME